VFVVSGVIESALNRSRAEEEVIRVP